MKVYQCNRDGFFLGETTAQVSPLEENKFLVPAYAVTEAPPEPKTNEIVVYDFNNKLWTLVPDYRGTVWYDQKAESVNRLKEINITEIGIAPLATWGLEPRAETKTEKTAREKLEAEEQAIKDAETASKIEITRLQCAKQMRIMGIITPEESLAMITTATPPSLVETLIKSMAKADQISAREDFASNIYKRNNPILVKLMSDTGATRKEIDDFFRLAVQL